MAKKLSSMTSSNRSGLASAVKANAKRSTKSVPSNLTARANRANASLTSSNRSGVASKLRKCK